MFALVHGVEFQVRKLSKMYKNRESGTCIGPLFFSIAEVFLLFVCTGLTKVERETENTLRWDFSLDRDNIG